MSEQPSFSIPDRLPRRLTISFPIWGLLDTGHGGPFGDPDRFMREHAERGFNCVRLEGGAGLAYGLDGKRRGPVEILPVFGEYSSPLRQFDCAGGPGSCDALERLIALCEAAKKYDIYLALSSWFYLHTFWQMRESINDELYAVPPHERFGVFARFLDQLLCDLEKRGLDDRIAFAEIFNEADALLFVDGYGHQNGMSVEEIRQFRDEHDEALRFLRQRHPQILFAFDSWRYHADPDQIPASLQVYDFHNYYFGDLYNAFERDPKVRETMLDGRVTHEMIRATRDGRRPVTEDWVERTWFYNNLRDECISEANAWLEDYLTVHEAECIDRINRSVAEMTAFAAEHFPGVPLVCGEGAGYCGSKKLSFEDISPRYWAMVEQATRCYRDAGLWGTVVRTCCGPEDPGWYTAAEHIRRVNDIFLGKED